MATCDTAGEGPQHPDRLLPPAPATEQAW